MLRVILTIDDGVGRGAGRPPSGSATSAAGPAGNREAVTGNPSLRHQQTTVAVSGSDAATPRHYTASPGG
jgi:hypothetical protein